jgi:GH24 family phage-related lysozyme (muramidase)
MTQGRLNDLVETLSPKAMLEFSVTGGAPVFADGTPFDPQLLDKPFWSSGTDAHLFSMGFGKYGIINPGSGPVLDSNGDLYQLDLRAFNESGQPDTAIEARQTVGEQQEKKTGIEALRERGQAVVQQEDFALEQGGPDDSELDDSEPPDNLSAIKKKVSDVVSKLNPVSSAKAADQPPRKPESTAGRGSFDSEGTGFDQTTADNTGMKRDKEGHLGSVTDTTAAERKQFNLPKDSSLVLKGKNHKTFHLAVKAEAERDHAIVKLGERYYSIPVKTMFNNAKAAAVATLKTNDTPLNRLISDEGGDVPASYFDSVGVLTGGTGHELSKTERAKYPEGTPIPDTLRKQWFTADMKTAAADAKSLLPKGLKKTAVDVVTNMAFNLGKPKLKKFSKMLEALNKKPTPDYATAAAEMADSDWAKQVGVGKHSDGTLKRASRMIAAMRALSKPPESADGEGTESPWDIKRRRVHTGESIIDSSAGPNLAFKTTKIQALMERSSTNPVIIPALQKAGAKLGIKLVITDGPRTVAQQKAIMRKMWKTNRKQYIKNYGDEPPETNTFTSKHLSSNAADLRIPPTFKKTKALREQFGKQVEDALGQGAQVHVEGNHLHVNFTRSGK